MFKKISSVFLLFIFTSALTGCGQQISTGDSVTNINKKVQTTNTSNQKTNGYPISSAETVADKLEVYYFHRTQRCYSCLTIGKYVKETIEDNFAEEIQNGTIDFQEINVELPENREVAEKFKASGSSLFINAVKNNQDDIGQDVNVWRLVTDENKFKSYLRDRLNSLLGK
ncbi:MAG: nitrophenyl compound nitroreductase subunit ArsF family protein [Patescibacteria group bacterium]